MVEWHPRLSVHGVSKLWEGDGQECLMCCSPWGGKELDTTEAAELNQVLRWENWGIAGRLPLPQDSALLALLTGVAAF